MTTAANTQVVFPKDEDSKNKGIKGRDMNDSDFVIPLWSGKLRRRWRRPSYELGNAKEGGGKMDQPVSPTPTVGHSFEPMDQGP